MPIKKTMGVKAEFHTCACTGHSSCADLWIAADTVAQATHRGLKVLPLALSVFLLAGCLVFFFVAVSVGAFVALLVAVFWSLLLCSWRPGTRLGSCMVVSVPLVLNFGCYFLI